MDALKNAYVTCYASGMPMPKFVNADKRFVYKSIEIEEEFPMRKQATWVKNLNLWNVSTKE